MDDANEPPAITGTVPDSFDEGTTESPATLEVVAFMADDPDTDVNANRGITWSLSGPDAGDFTIVGGALTFRASPNYEKPADADGDNVYKVTVAATDGDSNRGERSVEVKVANVDEPGVVTLSAVQPRVGVSVTASLTDVDGGVTGVTWQWSNGGNIEGATSDTYTPTSADTGMLTATAMYTDAEGADKTASVDSANPVAADTRNKAPVFADQDDVMEGDQNTEAERTIAENSDAGTAVGGGEVIATDPNTGDEVSYTLGGPDASSFAVGLTTGVITVGAGTKLDFETKVTYMVTVIATDSFGESASIDVTIKVTDVNEGPEISRGGLAISGLRNIPREENDSAVLGTYTATGPESASARWTLSGDDRGDFRISSAGVLTFRSTPDFENPADADGDNVYEVTIEARDGTYTAMLNVTVTVTDVDEGGPVVVGCDVAPVDRYDTDGDGTINRVEVEDAILDFIGIGANPCNISRTEVEDVVLAYLGL